MNPEKKWGQFERLRPAQIESIKRETPVAYVPFGAIEWHSYHAPTGLDCHKSHGLLRELASVVGGLVLPPLYVGTDSIKPFKGFKQTIEHSRETVRLLASEILEQLADEGFRVIVLLSGHYSQGQQDMIAEAAAEFRERHPDIGLWSGGDNIPLEGKFQMNHAARGETSFQLYFEPDTVDLSLLPSDRVATLDDDGVWGDDPREATREEGERMVHAFIEYMEPRVRELLRESAR